MQDSEHTMRRRAGADRPNPNALVEAHVSLIEHVVQQVAARFPRHVDRDELRSAAAAGLVDAANRYDPGTGVPFNRYASIRMRGAVIDASRTRDWATRRLRRDLREIDDAHERLEERLQRTPDDVEVAAELGVEVDRVRERRAAQVVSTVLTLDRSVAVGEGEASPLADRVLEDDAAWLPEEALERSELVGTLREAIAHLPDELRRVLVAHHFHGVLLRDIAVDLGVTEARASQLRYEAIRALQAFFATVFEEVDAVPDAAPGKRRRAAYVSQLSARTTLRARLDAERARAAYDASEAAMR